MILSGWPIIPIILSVRSCYTLYKLQTVPYALCFELLVRYNSVVVLFRVLVFRQLGVYLSIVIFYLKFNYCAWVYVMKFCRLKIVSRAVDAKIWSAKRRNWDISDIASSLSSIQRESRGGSLKHLRRVWEQCHQSEHGKKMVFLVLRRIVLTLVTLHVQEDFRVLMKTV